MSPHRQLSQSSNRHPTQDQDIFLGFASSLSPPDKEHPDAPRKLDYSFVLHDGSGVVESEDYTFELTVPDDEEEAGKEVKRFASEVLGLMRKIQTNKHMNIRLIAVAEHIPKELKGKVDIFPVIWLHVDAVPFVVTPSTSIFTKLPNPANQANATAAVAAAVKNLHPATHSATVADTAKDDHRVLVDCNEQVKLCSLRQYQESTTPELWGRFITLANHIRQKKTTIAFFSATPQGGGVALMRHALVRLCRLVGIDVKWYTPEGHPTIFDVTKRKIHNVLQGVAPEGVEMTDEDKKWFEIWTEQNYEEFWTKGAIDADVIIIDDPQLQSDLTDDPSTPQHRTWNYLFDFIKDVDLFVAHPVKFFVPKNVKETLPVLYMAPSTDPLDGLNKLYGHASVRYYRDMFNNLSATQCGVTIDWERGYICQVARFDPSKGIDHLLAAYLEFRQKLDQSENPPQDGGPQLIIMGHGSVDDPDGTMIYEQIHETLSSSDYELVKGDVSVVRAPPSDSILGCILQGAWVATQLSTREGFEVKVTEAVNKRVPIIASDAGGIPLQVKHGKNGWIVPAGESSPVAQLLLDIDKGKEQVHRDLSNGRDFKGKTDPNSVAEAFVGSYDASVPPIKDDKHATSEDFWTVGNTARWLLLISRMLGLEPDAIGANEYGTVDNAEELLKEMGVGESIPGKGSEATNVWKMLIGKDLIDGEGDLI